MIDYELHAVTGDYADFTDAELDGFRKSLRAEGLLVPIVIWKGFVVDGRHRERLCREMNIARRYADISNLTEEEMRKIVAGLNQHRRTRTKPLTNKEKNMKIAEELRRDPARSDRAIAAVVDVDHKTVATVRTKGGGGEFPTPPSGRKSRSDKIGDGQKTGRKALPTAAQVDEKKAQIEKALRADPTKSNNFIGQKLGCHGKTVEKIRKAIEAGEPIFQDKRGAIVPDGAILSELCAEGIALEEKGLSPVAAAKQIKLSIHAYTAGRDIIQLANNPRLNQSHRAKVQAAIAEMDRTRRATIAYEGVKSLVLRMWGGQLHAAHSAARRERVVEDYMHAIIVFAQGAERIGAMLVPFLSEDEQTRARTELQQARTAIDDAIKHLKGGV